MSVGPAGLQCITAHHIESDELETFLGVAHIRTDNLPEHIRFAAASRARTRTSEQFNFQKRFSAVIPGNGQFVSDLLDVRWFKSHFPDSSWSGGLPAAEGDLEIAFPCSALTKNGCSNAHQCRALVDSNCKILRHAHRKMRQ